MTDAIDVAGIDRIRRDTDAREVALAAYEQLFGLLGGLGAPAWSARTECPAWDVADMVGHLVGAAKSNASLREMVRQQVYGARHRKEFDGNALDATNALQVLDHAGMTPAERIAELRRIAPAAVEGRLRVPGLVRRTSVHIDPGGSTAEGMPERLGMAHLLDTIYTRDVWLHSIDIERATGAHVDRTAALDGRLVADAVAEWASRHGQPFDLHLTGPGRSHFVQGRGGAQLELDAIEFARALSGRAPGDGLLGVRVLF